MPKKSSQFLYCDYAVKRGKDFFEIQYKNLIQYCSIEPGERGEGLAGAGHRLLLLHPVLDPLLPSQPGHQCLRGDHRPLFIKFNYQRKFKINIRNFPSHFGNKSHVYDFFSLFPTFSLLVFPF